jgi:uncharacterized membrane protein
MTIHAIGVEPPGALHATRTHTRWLAIFLAVYGLWVWLPWAAPILMHYGLDGAGRVVYFIYSFFCHQLPERSFFLFGPRTMYPLASIQAVWRETINPMILRQFVGDTAMGWKVAWSDRMISFYGSVWVFALVWAAFWRRIPRLPWWGFVLLLLPITLDGATHMVSDFSGIGQGFRYTNQWLASVTGGGLPAWFYAGDALGSFNSWMRLVTGVLAGAGIVWFAFPAVEDSFGEG